MGHLLHHIVLFQKHSRVLLVRDGEALVDEVGGGLLHLLLDLLLELTMDLVFDHPDDLLGVKLFSRDPFELSDNTPGVGMALFSQYPMVPS